MTVNDVKQPTWALGMLLPANGYARCYRCRRPRWAVHHHHTVWYEPRRGQGALCEHCWGRTTPEQRWQAYVWVCSLTDDWSSSEIAALRRAVLQAQDAV